MDERTLTTLEVETLTKLLARHAQTPKGRVRAQELSPSTDRFEIEKALDMTSECAEYLATGERFGLSGIEDLEAAFARLRIDEASLEPSQILALEHLLGVAVDLRAQFSSPELKERFPSLAAVTGDVPDLLRLLGEIRGKVLPGGEIDDDASPELRGIRREINSSRARVFRSLESVLHKQTRAVQDEIVTFRNGRFVIPIRTDARSQVPGVVHGLSSSGQTTFIEPLTVIEQNNEIVRLREREEAEIARILLSISRALRENLSAILLASRIVAEIDLAQAKGRLSLEFRCVRPLLSRGGNLRLMDARHMLLEHSLGHSGGEVVPISVELDANAQTMVISGPNAGGKTVVVKTIGLIALTAQMGLHVPARDAELPLFEKIFADIGDQQSISANLSTFTAHMRNISEMARKVAVPALILLDEVGTGTDPDEGAALAVAIVDFFRRTGVTTIATTHYNGLKMWAAQTEGVLNASVEFDVRTLRPTYRLIMGVAGASAGLEIARRMEIPDCILDSAGSLVEPSHARAAAYLNRLREIVEDRAAQVEALAEERAATADEYSRLARDFARRESERQAEFEKALHRVLREFAAESERLIGSLEDRAAAERLKRAAARQSVELRRIGDRLRREAQDANPDRVSSISPDPAARATEASASQNIEAGDNVRIYSLGRVGRVDSVSGNIYTVIVGPLKYRAVREELEPAEPGPVVHATHSEPHQAVGRDLEQGFATELKVIGMTADEATDRVDKYLDEAFLAGVESVRIIHGHGKGILRRAIARLLTDHPQVEKFAPASPHEGGGGATVVEL